MSELHQIVSAQHRRRLARVVGAVVTASAFVCLAALVRVAIAHADPKTDAVDVTAAPFVVPPVAAPPQIAPTPAAPARDAGALPHAAKKPPKHRVPGAPR